MLRCIDREWRAGGERLLGYPRMWRSISIGCLLASAACDRGKAAPLQAAPELSAPVASAVQSAESPRAHASSTLDALPEASPRNELTLIWTRDRAKQIETHFIEPSGKEVSRPGLFIAIGATLVHWVSKTTRRKSSACPAGNPNPYSTYELETITLEIVGTARGVVLLPVAHEASEMANNPDEYARDEYSPLTSLGSYLFARGRTVFWPCGMHPQSGAEFYPFEIAPDGSATQIAQADLYANARSKLADALIQLNAKASKDPDSPDGVVTQDELETTLAYPSFAGGLRWNVQVTAPATWAGSYGGWSGYTRSVMVQVPSLPEKLQSLVPLAERAVAYAKTHPHVEIGGISRGRVSIPRQKLVAGLPTANRP